MCDTDLVPPKVLRVISLFFRNSKAAETEELLSKAGVPDLAVFQNLLLSMQWYPNLIRQSPLAGILHLKPVGEHQHTVLVRDG